MDARESRLYDFNGFWIHSLAGFWIPMPSIPDSTSKNFLDSVIRITLHWAKRFINDSFAGVIADLDPCPNPLADMDPPSQIWTPLPNVSFKHRLYHTWSLILFGSFFPMFFSITTQHSSVKVKKNSHFVPVLPHVL